MYENQTNWDLVVLNPSFVLGPSLNPKFNTSESYNIIKQISEGYFKFGIPKLPIGVIDVRDLAKAHYKLHLIRIVLVGILLIHQTLIFMNYHNYYTKSMERNIQYQKNMHQNG